MEPSTAAAIGLRHLLEASLCLLDCFIIGSFELHSSRVEQGTHQLVKVLTVATVITGITGEVAGVFGMIFNTPVANSGLPGFCW